MQFVLLPYTGCIQALLALIYLLDLCSCSELVIFISQSSGPQSTAELHPCRLCLPLFLSKAWAGGSAEFLTSWAERLKKEGKNRTETEQNGRGGGLLSAYPSLHPSVVSVGSALPLVIRSCPYRPVQEPALFLHTHTLCTGTFENVHIPLENWPQNALIYFRATERRQIQTPRGKREVIG